MPPISTGVRLFALLALGILLGLIAHYIYKAGGDDREAPWLVRESKANADAANRIEAAENKARAAEARYAAAMASISGAYLNAQQEGEREKAAAVDRVRAGQRLYIGAKCPAPGGSAAPEAPTGAGARDGETRAELSESAAEWLIGLASEADAVVRQLTACQAVVEADRAPQP